MKQLSDLLPPRSRLIRGFWISVALWMVFLVLTAYTSVATLLSRVAADDVMKAASSNAWGGKIALELGGFLAMQVLLHLFFAVLTWLLACAGVIANEKLRPKFGRLVVGWFSVLAGATLAYNALWYPRTLIGAYYSRAMSIPVGPWHAGQWVYWGTLVVCVTVTARAIVTLYHEVLANAGRRTLFAGGVVAIAAGIAATFPSARSGTAAAATMSRPNVILLGIDSLRLEQLRRFGGTGITPNLDRFIASADLFEDATTPVARTFPSWVAILTGRAPTLTGARFNLAERAMIRTQPTIGDFLRDHGYRTVYSTDEVRFANIDESYGFDQVVTPRIGASDFLVGSYNELPLASLFINTRIGEWLFPFSYANRGVATMFQPSTYIERLRREVSFDQPTFFIAHLTAAHWPYYTSDVPFGIPDSAPSNQRPLYQVGLQTADRMFGELVQLLEAKGAFRNAIVIVLSDHGEALSLPSDSFFDETFHVDGLRAPLKMLDYGHGQSVLSKTQYHVLLSFRALGAAKSLGDGPRTFAYPVTVEDIAPTVINYLGLKSDGFEATGLSLLPVLEGRLALQAESKQRVRFTETDLAVLPAPGGGGAVDEVATARENAMFFQVDPTTARLHMKRRYAPLALAYKERAAFSGDSLLAAIPAGPDAHQFLYFDFKNRYGKLLLARPDDAAPDAQRLWDAMSQHYGSELKNPVAITPEDWPRIASEWENYIHDKVDSQARVAGASESVAAN